MSETSMSPALGFSTTFENSPTLTGYSIAESSIVATTIMSPLSFTARTPVSAPISAVSTFAAGIVFTSLLIGFIFFNESQSITFVPAKPVTATSFEPSVKALFSVVTPVNTPSSSYFALTIVMFLASSAVTLNATFSSA